LYISRNLGNSEQNRRQKKWQMHRTKPQVTLYIGESREIFLHLIPQYCWEFPDFRQFIWLDVENKRIIQMINLKLSLNI
jgi:hypothetical protein